MFIPKSSNLSLIPRKFNFMGFNNGTFRPATTARLQFLFECGYKFKYTLRTLFKKPAKGGRKLNYYLRTMEPFPEKLKSLLPRATN